MKRIYTEKMRAWNSKYRQDNLEEIKVKQKIYSQLNREKLRAKSKVYYYKNNEDPNNFLIPITTSIADFGNMGILAVLIIIFL